MIDTEAEADYCPIHHQNSKRLCVVWVKWFDARGRAGARFTSRFAKKYTTTT